MKVNGDKSMVDTQSTANSQGAQKAKASKRINGTDTVSISGGKTTESGASNDSAKVQLSERVQDMKKIREQINKTPDVDEAKVAKYKALIAKGEYKPDAKKVADKMVDEHAYSALFSDE